MTLLLKSPAVIAALMTGAGILIAEAQDSGSRSGLDATCADIVGLDPQQAERALYFVAGLSEAEGSAKVRTSVSAALLPVNNDSTDPDSRTDPLAQKLARQEAYAGMVDSGHMVLPKDSIAWSNVPIDWTDHTGDGHTVAMARGLMGSGSAGRQIRGSQSMAMSHSGQSSPPRGVDPTTTAGVFGGSTGDANGSGFFVIPVELVVSDCWSTPDAMLIDLLKQHRR